MAHTLDGQGDRRTAALRYQQSVDIFREIGDEWALTHPLCDLAWHIWYDGRLHEALALMQEHLDVFRRLQSAGSIPMALAYIADMAITLGDFATAAQAAQEKAEIEVARGLPVDRAYALYSVAAVNFACGNIVEAQHQLASAHKIARATGDHGFTADVLYLLARIALCRSSYAEAATLLDESRKMAEAGEPKDERNANILLAMGQVAWFETDAVRAADLIRASLEKVRDIAPGVPVRLEWLALACTGLGQGAQAATLLGAAHGLRARMGNPILPVDRAYHAMTLDAVTSALADDLFQQAWNDGAALAIAQAVALALRSDRAAAA